MKRQAKLGEAFLKHYQETFGLLVILESQHKVIGIANDNDVAMGRFPAPVFNPQVEDIVQIEIS